MNSHFKEALYLGSLNYFRDFFKKLEEEIEYLSGDLAKVKVFGKIYNIPRQQAGNVTYLNIQIQQKD